MSSPWHAPLLHVETRPSHRAKHGDEKLTFTGVLMVPRPGNSVTMNVLTQTGSFTDGQAQVLIRLRAHTQEQNLRSGHLLDSAREHRTAGENIA